MASDGSAAWWPGADDSLASQEVPQGLLAQHVCKAACQGTLSKNSVLCSIKTCSPMTLPLCAAHALGVRPKTCQLLTH